MKLARNLVVVLTALILVGFIRRPYDDKVANDLRDRDLLPPPLSLDTREELGQVGLAIALGGLRPLMASMLNIQAHSHWQEQEWYELEGRYKTIVALQPRIRYYWDTGSWHLYSNAYADFATKPGLSEGRRERKKQEYFDKGIAFLERGAEANPKDWRLWAQLGNAHSSNFRPQDFGRAAACFERGYKINGHPQLLRHHVYALSRVPERADEAWEVAQRMWADEYNRRYSSPITIFYALQYRAGESTYSLEDIFGSRLVAARKLPDYWFRQVEGFPMNGVAELLGELCEEFEIPEYARPLRFPAEKEFQANPFNEKPYPLDPRTGEPKKRTWRSIWMNEPRDFYLHLLKEWEAKQQQKAAEEIQ